MRKLIYILTIFLAGVAITNAAASFTYSRTPGYSNPTQTYLTDSTGTTTVSIPKYSLYNLDSTYTQQGACVRIKDSDGAGFTFLTVNNGVGTFSALSCE